MCSRSSTCASLTETDMATDAWTRTFPNSDDGEFRSWGSDLSSRLAGVGLVQTSDTGQINWGSVSRPSEDNYGGYEVWRFDDALQGTAPVFIKIEYGTANMSGS